MKIDEARQILSAVGMPEPQCSGICCYTLLAMTKSGDASAWRDASNDWIRIHDIIRFIADNYNVKYAENSRETFRKQTLHHFRNAALVEDNGKATNSPNYKYRITDETLALIRAFSTKHWDKELRKFLSRHQKLIEVYASKKKMHIMPVNINGEDFVFSPGKHNMLQKAILEEFAPRFAPYAECLYVGDTTKKDLVKNVILLEELGFNITLHDKMPDVVLYNREKNWLYFIEAVTSVGPMDAKRLMEIQRHDRQCRHRQNFRDRLSRFPDLQKIPHQPCLGNGSVAGRYAGPHDSSERRPVSGAALEQLRFHFLDFYRAITLKSHAERRDFSAKR